MLNGIHLVDYGNHRDTRLTFGRMTALVGQNGAGKTNMLRGIMEINQSGSAEEAKNFPENANVRRGAREWLITSSWPGLLYTKIDEEQQGNWATRIGSSKKPLWLWHEGGGNHIWLPNPQEDLRNIPIWQDYPPIYEEERKGVLYGRIEPGQTVRPLEEDMDPVWNSQYFKTAGSYLQGPSYSELSTPVLSEDCRDLAWMIAYLKGDKDDVFADITAALRKVVPTFHRVRHRPSPVSRIEKKEVVINKIPRLYDDPQTVMGQELRFDMASGSDLPASAISEGTLITLAILTAIMHDDTTKGKSRIKTILLDDIESGLHPSAQRDLIRQLRRLQETRPELQIIFSSHSPYIIDEMQPEDVWLFAPDIEGIAHCAKLSEHPDARRALEVLTTGEFWSAEGEGWVLDRAKQSNDEAVTAK